MLPEDLNSQVMNLKRRIGSEKSFSHLEMVQDILPVIENLIKLIEDKDIVIKSYVIEIDNLETEIDNLYQNYT